MRLFVSNFLMFLLFLLTLIQPVEASEYEKYADTEEVCTIAAQQYEKKYQIKKHLLTTITNVESGRWNPRKQRNTAWPWTVNAQGQGHFYATKQQAINAVKKFQIEMYGNKLQPGRKIPVHLVIAGHKIAMTRSQRQNSIIYHIAYTTFIARLFFENGKKYIHRLGRHIAAGPRPDGYMA